MQSNSHNLQPQLTFNIMTVPSILRITYTKYTVNPAVTYNLTMKESYQNALVHEVLLLIKSVAGNEAPEVCINLRSRTSLKPLSLLY